MDVVMKNPVNHGRISGKSSVYAPVVMFVIDTLQTGGAELSLLENISRFKNIKPIVVHLYQGDYLKPKFIAAGITVHSLSITKKYGFINAYIQLLSYVKKIRPSVMVAYLTRSEIISRLVAHRLNIPVIGTFVSELYSREYNQSLSYKAKLGVWLFKVVNSFTARWCTGFIANSESAKYTNAIELNIPLSKVEVIYRGRDNEKFVKGLHEFEPGNAVRFLNIGRLVSVKNQEELIRGFTEYLKKHPGAELSVAGEGPLKNNLQQLITSNNLDASVFLLGQVADIPVLMQQYDCLVVASRSEGFSGTIIEACFSGLPVLASDILSNREIISHLRSGFLFQPGSAQAITDAMQWFTYHPQTAKTCADQAYKDCMVKFRLDNQSARMEDFLLTTMTNR